MKNSIIPNRLKHVRRDRALTQAQAAEMLGISRSTYASWETGTRMPTAVELTKFCREFAVTFDYMCGRSDEARKLAGEDDEQVDLARLTPLGRRVILFIYRAFLKDPQFGIRE